MSIFHERLLLQIFSSRRSVAAVTMMTTFMKEEAAGSVFNRILFGREMRARYGTAFIDIVATANFIAQFPHGEMATAITHLTLTA